MRTSMPEWTLIKLSQAGDDEAFKILFELHNMAVYRYLVGLVGNDEDARDLTQLTFLQAWRKLPNLRDISRFKAWLFRIARNQAYDKGRSEMRASVQTFEDLEKQRLLASNSGFEDKVAEAEFIKLVLAELPTKYRECLLLQEGGLSLSEIAKVLEISPESARTYASNAKREFRLIYHRLVQELEATGERK